MKKLILAFAAIAISVGAYAQADSTYRQMNQREFERHQNQRMQNNPVDKSIPDGVMMKEGKILMVKNGEVTTLDHDMTMTNGTKVVTDGNYTSNNGTTMKLREGQHIDMDGKLTFLKSKKDRNMYLVPDTTRTKDLK